MRHTLRWLVVRRAELPAGGNGTLSSVSDTVVIVQSGLTAVTAYCAFQAVRLNKEQWRTAKHPDIHLQVLLSRQAGTTDLALVNIGGWARGALVAMSVGDQRASSYLGDSLIAPGERLYVHTKLPQSEQSEDTKVLLLYRGMDETSYRVLRGTARETLSDDRDRPETSLPAEWSSAYPGDDWSGKTAVAIQVKAPSRPGG
jgi:hypothetical protein